MAAPARETRQVAQEEETREMRSPTDPGRGRRWVLWTGMMLGTTVLALAAAHGIRLRLPLRPAFLADLAGVVLEWLALTGVAIWAAHLVRVHHRRMIRYAATQALAGTIAAGRAASHHGRRAHGRAQRRWQARGDSWRQPLLLTRHTQEEPGLYVVMGSARLPAGPDQDRELPAAVPGPGTEPAK